MGTNVESVQNNPWADNFSTSDVLRHDMVSEYPDAIIRVWTFLGKGEVEGEHRGSGERKEKKEKKKKRIEQWGKTTAPPAYFQIDD